MCGIILNHGGYLWSGGKQNLISLKIKFFRAITIKTVSF
jgi:hypothetical protein